MKLVRGSSDICILRHLSAGVCGSRTCCYCHFEGRSGVPLDRLHVPRSLEDEYYVYMAIYLMKGFAVDIDDGSTSDEKRWELWTDSVILFLSAAQRYEV